METAGKADGEHVASGSFLLDVEKMKQKTDEDNLKISNSTAMAFVTKFPFLTKFIGGEKIREASVLLISENLLGKYNNAFLNYILLDENGDELTRVGAITAPRRSWLAPMPRSKDVGEALGYLKKQCQAQKAKFVLEIFSYYGHVIKLYMPPKGFTIISWLEKQNELALARLEDDLQQIDSKAKIIDISK